MHVRIAGRVRTLRALGQTYEMHNCIRTSAEPGNAGTIKHHPRLVAPPPPSNRRTCNSYKSNGKTVPTPASTWNRFSKHSVRPRGNNVGQCRSAGISMKEVSAGEKRTRTSRRKTTIQSNLYFRRRRRQEAKVLQIKISWTA